MEKKYWIVYDKINEDGSPLTYNQRANLLLGELRNLKKLLSVALCFLFVQFYSNEYKIYICLIFYENNNK